ncbi:hypothetical protein HZF24_07885 [Sedimentibacter hydroxybenzoicus DSM 7310]|uniref:Uncharacterized protein n=1 Tax=Sedimentibacter hydroxybenzoicus DSM 7310 TaxID=1123245 RepID=A0A974GW88_SEDHY|nr:hypothetical protein [Sedimentibacter hydroxybenzoicus]NYB74061.1 hypothetical protein [Sedimentibacter hydroxybenzoicus DSM 7310]
MYKESILKNAKKISYYLLIVLLAVVMSACSPVSSVHETKDDKSMTLDDVRKLSAKGEDLLFEDLSGYRGYNLSSDLNSYIMVYYVKGGYRLIVYSKPDSKPSRADLESVWESGGSGIDIRYKDVDAFIRDNPSQDAITEEQALDIAEKSLKMELEAVSWYILGESFEPIGKDAIFARALLDSTDAIDEPCWVLRVKETPEWEGSYYAVGKKSGKVYTCVEENGKFLWHNQ